MSHSLEDPALDERAMNGEDREAVTGYLRRELVGPREGEEEVVLDGTPFDRYMLGTLYPRATGTETVTSSEEEGSTSSPKGARKKALEVDEYKNDSPLNLSSQMMPSALGISFLCSERSAIRIRPQGAIYRDKGGQPAGKGPWERKRLDPGDPEGILLQPGQPGGSVLEGKCSLHVVWRPLPSGRQLLTVTITNATTSEGHGTRPRGENCVFQAGLSCRPERGRILSYPSLLAMPRDEEEEDLALQYRDAPVFAAGHGCAPAWDKASDGRVEWVRTDVLPIAEVHDQTHLETPSKVLSLAFLASPGTGDDLLFSELKKFVADYRLWMKSEGLRAQDLAAEHKAAGRRTISRIEKTIERIERGITLMERTPRALKAFRLANMAMLMQMAHGKLSKFQRSLGSPLALPTTKSQYLSEGGLRWRPFQLAFLLLVLPGLANGEDQDREVVDLIWFPTGGGKTEAYLAAAAFEIVYRRMTHGEMGGGTSVLTRYTLRMLTAQQFQRTSLLVCALELLRKEDTELGETPISIGLWVGGTTSPNNFKDAKEQFQNMLAGSSNPFLVDRCPWCGTELVPDRTGDPDAPGLGIASTATSFQFHCPEPACPFHKHLPLQIVDDAIYQDPPTILLATVDKLARLTWIDQGGHLLTGGGRFLPPGLIIQDELHLLSGPLGTMVGLYETAISALTSIGGVRPKVIASTATIRRAGDQIRSLFDSDVALFPPSGLDAGHSYFAHPDTGSRGRLYVGVMSQDHTPETALVRLSGALAQAPNELDLSTKGRDAYWTQVIYNNSLRELGKTEFKLLDDIPKRIEAIATPGRQIRNVDADVTATLTSQIPPEQIPEILKRMDTPCGKPRALSVLLCTNMLSVGIDVGRLGLMVVNGQPKTTSEYIQATSRVGRSRDKQGRPDRPGLVLVLLAWNKARDRSHYEAFPGYHSTFYSQVEPTSVTPFTSPARQRALHAAFVILLRHLGPLSGNDGPERFNAADPRIIEAKELILERCRSIDPMEEGPTRSDLEERMAEWARTALRAREDTATLRYSSRSPDRSLLHQFDDPDPEGWPTLNSMRNVDRECRLSVFGEL